MKYQTTVLLNWALPAGAVIGKKGCNVRWLSQQAGGAKLEVTDDRVIIRGHRQEAVNTAARLLRAQIEANKRLASPAYPHPLRVDWVLLEQPFGSDPRVCFRVAGNDAARTTARPEQLFVLSPAAAGGGGDNGDNGDNGATKDLADLLAAVSLKPTSSSAGGKGSGFSGRLTTVPSEFHSCEVLPGGQVAQALADAARRAATNEPRFDVLKIRFNLGKQYFFNLGALEARHALKLEDLRGWRPDPARSQSVFSNHVPAAVVPRVTSWLTGALGFILVDTKATATLHVIDEVLNVHYAVALTLGEQDGGRGPGGGGAAVTLRKVKSSATKCHMLVLEGGPEQLDLRAKLLGQRRELQDDTANAVAAQIVRRCNEHGYDAATGHGGLLPPEAHLDLARNKTKRVYEGTFRASSSSTLSTSTPGLPPLRLKLSVVDVEDHTGARHCEITGTVPAVDFELAELLQTRKGASRDSSGSSGRLSSGGGGGDGGGCDSWAPVDALWCLAEFIRELNAAAVGQ